MILSEQTRRWSEVQFYYFCLDTYNIRHNMIDVILLIEVICQIAELDFTMLKIIATKMIGDTNYLPTKDEIIVLADLHNIKQKDLIKATGISKSTIHNTLKTKKDIYIPFPKFDIKEDNEIYKFNQMFQKIKQISI